MEEIKLCYVLDNKGVPLSTTYYKKGWVLIRKKKAEFVSFSPFTIKLIKDIPPNENETRSVLGIDTGSKFTGIAITQDCKTRVKVLFKGTIFHRTDVSKLMETRKVYRRYRRSHKRYRPARFLNRRNSIRKERIPPSIKNNKEEIIRVLKKISKFIKFDSICVEDVKIDIRKLLDPEVEDYQKSNRLDNNLRLACLIRDEYTCKLCGKTHTKLEAHHIKPRRLQGSDTISNLISLCTECHEKVTGSEEWYYDTFFKYTKKASINLKITQRCMQGKNYLYSKLQEIFKVPLWLTYGYITSTVRHQNNIPKTHANDAVCITGLIPKNINIHDHYIKPLRTKINSKTLEFKGFRLRDIINYKGITGYITSLSINKNRLNFKSIEGKEYKGYGFKHIKLIQRPICVCII